MSECAYCRSPVNGVGLFCCSSCELLSHWIKQGVSPLAEQNSVSEKWQKYNLIELEEPFNLSQNSYSKKFKFYIEGLQCSSCVHLLEDLPQFCNSVTRAKLNYSNRILEVDIKSSYFLGSLCQSIEDLGYTPTVLKENLDYENAIHKETRNDLKRIGVAGAIAANQMLFSIPLYAGLTGEMAFIFRWVSFFLFLPLVFYSATPFYKKAWVSLLVRRVNVDMMIVIALWAGFIFSTYSLLMGSDDLYFDSTASFIFLILLTRFWIKRHQNNFLQKNIFSDLFINEIYEKTDPQGQTDSKKIFITFNKIQRGELLKLKQSQLIPCDAILTSEVCDVDLSFLTGEAYPVKKHKGETLLAGSRLLSSEASIKCQTESLESALAQALSKLDDRGGKNSFQTLTDLTAHRLTLVVFTVAGAFFILTYQHLGFEAFKRCLALITIACPCAVAFGTPLAHNIGLRKAIQKGFFIKSETVFEKINQISKIIFDKTGTLTSAQLRLTKTFPADISDEYKSIILGLEKSSMHPIALSLKKSWIDHEIKNITQVHEIASLGVEAYDEGHHYQLTKSKIDQNDQVYQNTIQVDFSIDGRRMAYLFFEEDLRPEAKSVIKDFYKRKFDVMMLSGDKRPRAIEVAKQLAIRPAFVFSEQSAESKKEIIQQQNPCLFVGDGLNDLLGLHEAHVSYAIKGAFESTLQVSDVYAPQKDLTSILEIVDLSQEIHKTTQVNLLFAVFYNSVGGIMALAGLINPLIAAILMPASSFVITAHTVYRLNRRIR